MADSVKYEGVLSSNANTNDLEDAWTLDPQLPLLPRLRSNLLLAVVNINDAHGHVWEWGADVTGLGGREGGREGGRRKGR